MSDNWSSIQERYKRRIDALAINNRNKTIFKRRINNTFNTNVMQKVVENAMRTMYKKKVDEIQYLTRTEKANAKSKINALINEQPMQNIVKNLNARSKTSKQNAFKKINELPISNTRKNKFKNKISRMTTKPTDDELKKLLKQAEGLWHYDMTVLLSFIVLISSKGTLMYTGRSTPFVTKIGNYKTPSVYLNNKTYAALKRYEQLYNKGEFLENILFYSIVIFFVRLCFLFIKDKTGAKKLLKSIMDVRLSRYTIGSISFEIMRKSAGQFAIASLTAYLHGQVYMMKERAVTLKPTDKLNTFLTSKALKLSYIWLASKFSKYLPSELNDELITKIVDFFKTLESYGIIVSPILLGRGLFGTYENVKNVASASASSIASGVSSVKRGNISLRSIGSVAGSVGKWAFSPPRTARTRGELLVLNNNRGTIYTFTNQNDIRNILNNQKYTNGGAQSQNDIILKSNNGTRYRVTKVQRNKATTYEPGFNSPQRN